MRVHCERKGGPVWRVRLEPGERRDAIVLDGAGLCALDALLTEAGESERCRVVVIEGQPAGFCSGMDLVGAAEGDGDYRVEFGFFVSCLQRLRTLERAVVALVDGQVVGGGVGLAAAADVAIATSRATFQLPELALGLVPAIVMPLLRERMPAQKARWMALSGAPVGARDALAMGLVDEVVDEAADLEVALRRLAKRLLRSSPRAVARLKRLAAEMHGLDCVAGIAEGAARTAAHVAEPEILAAIRGLGAGELPPWFDRYRPEVHQ